jgi:transcriptional regulator with XRE-family HTH domain
LPNPAQHAQIRPRAFLPLQNRDGAMTKKGPDLRDVEVGRRVRMFRLQRGLSQEKLGDALGLTFQQVQKYEKGTNRIGAGRIQHIAEILDIPVTSFFTSQGQEETSLNETVELLGTAAGLRLLRAYLRIRDPRTQQAVIQLVEKIAGGSARSNNTGPISLP